MKLFRYLPLLLLAVACNGTKAPQPEESAAPALVSSSPEDGVGNLTGTTLSIVFTFDQNIKCTAQAQAGITVDGGAWIDGVSAYATQLTVDVGGLARGKSYTLTLPEGTVQGYRTRQKGSAAIQFHFSTKATPAPPGPDPEPQNWESAADAAIHMGLGWNLGNTLESNSGDRDNMWIEAFTSRTVKDYETAWGQPQATRELIHMLREDGFGAIRVPVTWYPHMGTLSVSVSGDKGHWSSWTGNTVDPTWMARVKEVVGYVLDEGMYCILNVHHDTGSSSTAWLRADNEVYDSVKEKYKALWQQIATEFQDYGQRLVFESFNEMLDKNSTWNASTAEAHEVINKYNADFVATVRATGGKNTYRNLILNTYAASTQPAVLQAFRLPEDSVEGHLMAEVHSYAPYHFAFDTNTPKEVFDAACETEVKGIIDGLNTYLVSKGIPCVLGEFGADTGKRSENELAKQAACYVSAAAQYNIPCFYWMGLTDGQDRSVPQWTKPKLKDAILQAYEDSKK
ncbi:MAG: cellulase family glycosylhydrolase [Bacteroidales bacterium]|nr:cellulase family glycosylhydrolase [Bacteroidales bacterium]